MCIESVAKQQGRQSGEHALVDGSRDHLREELLEGSRLAEEYGLRCPDVSKAPKLKVGNEAPVVVPGSLRPGREVEQGPSQLLSDDAHIAETRHRFIPFEAIE